MRIKKTKKITHSELVEIGYEWLLKESTCGVAFKELVCIEKEQPDVIGFGSNDFSILLEAKASRSDFLRDKKKPFRKKPSKGMGSQRYYICPENMIKISDLPKGWGLIWVSEKTKKYELIHNPYRTRRYKRFRVKNAKGEKNLLYSALRRLQERDLVKEIYNR